MSNPEENQSDLSASHPHARETHRGASGVLLWLKNLIKIKPDNDENLREVLEEYIEEMSLSTEANDSGVSHELSMLSNILELKDMTAEDVMVPRADIVAIDISTPTDEFLSLLVQKRHIRMPVYRDTLDDIVGIIHVKDVLETLVNKQNVQIKSLIREAPFISPAMPVFDLLMMMRETRQQLVFVVDEYGGIDGLVTIGDLVSSIIGEVQDEFDKSPLPDLVEESDGSYIADARVEISDFEAKFGQILTNEDRDQSDTLGGFIFTLSGRVPARGEVIPHDPTGFVFEIMEADPRRVTRIRVRPPAPPISDETSQD